MQLMIVIEDLKHAKISPNMNCEGNLKKVLVWMND